MSSLITFRISERSLSLKVTRTFSLPHSHMNISSFTFIHQAWKAVVCDLIWFFRISERSLSLKVTRTFSLPHSHMNISSFTFIRQAWNSVVCDLVVKVDTNSREDCKNCKNRPPRPPPKLKTQPYFHAFVIVPDTLFRNNSKKLRLLKGYHINIILPRACKKFIVTKICPLIGSDKSAWRSGVGDLTSRTLTDAQCIHTGASDFRSAFVTSRTSPG